MNIAAARGRNYEEFEVHLFEPPDFGRRWVQQGYLSYLRSSDGKYSRQKFQSYVRYARVVIGEIRSAGLVEARFGVELLHDEGGPYVSMLYLEGEGMKFWIRDLIRALKQIASTYTAWMCEPRLWIGGRRGWRRYARRLGIEMDDLGWVHGWQEGLRDG